MLWHYTIRARPYADPAKQGLRDFLSPISTPKLSKTSLGMERNIFVHGYATDVASLYRSAGLSLLTSKGEGYALVIMESLCHGCPVVAFDVNYGPADMIRDGKTGALVPFNDEEALASALLEILNNPQRHEQMCDDVLRSARDFGADVVADKWRRLLQELSHTPAM
jgi:poly(glycerol-phosphate) alpha-glucosyltransferase